MSDLTRWPVCPQHDKDSITDVDVVDGSTSRVRVVKRDSQIQLLCLEEKTFAHHDTTVLPSSLPSIQAFYRSYFMHVRSHSCGTAERSIGSMTMSCVHLMACCTSNQSDSSPHTATVSPSPSHVLSQTSGVCVCVYLHQRLCEVMCGTDRCPAWCDRVLMNSTAHHILRDGSTVYEIIGRHHCMGDHKVCVSVCMV